MGMIRVYNDRFCWKKKKEDEVLIVKMKMEDFNSSSKPVRHIVFGRPPPHPHTKSCRLFIIGEV